VKQLSLFNKTEKRSKIKMQTSNMEGAPAFKPSEKMELVLRAATAFVQTDKFYETGEAADARFVGLIRKIAKTDPEFVLKLAWYARHEFYMRSPATLILAEASDILRENGGVYGGYKYVSDTIMRVDDMTELVACIMKSNKKNGRSRSNLPMMIKRGIADAFPKFDEYQLAKYTKDEMFVTPKDVYFLTHPAPEDDDQYAVYDRMISGRLAIPETWEAYISINGSTKENWDYILGKMGYLGILRNLRNLIKHGVDEDRIVDELTDANRIRKSKIFPYQYYSAYRAIQGKSDFGKVMGGLSTAMDISAQNFPMLYGTTAVFCDNSGSMDGNVHPKSQVTHADVGNVFGAMIASRSENSVVYGFGSTVIPSGINPRDSILTNIEKIHHAGQRAGGGTHTGQCIELLENKKIKADRIVFFTDEQGYGSPSCYQSLKSYCKQMGLDPYVYTFDIAHYGTTQFPENEPRHVTVGGWSDKALNFIHMYEGDKTTLLRDVENVGIVN